MAEADEGALFEAAGLAEKYPGGKSSRAPASEPAWAHHADKLMAIVSRARVFLIPATLWTLPPLVRIRHPKIGFLTASVAEFCLRPLARATSDNLSLKVWAGDCGLPFAIRNVAKAILIPGSRCM